MQAHCWVCQFYLRGRIIKKYLIVCALVSMIGSGSLALTGMQHWLLPFLIGTIGSFLSIICASYFVNFYKIGSGWNMFAARYFEGGSILSGQLNDVSDDIEQSSNSVISGFLNLAENSGDQVNKIKDAAKSTATIHSGDEVLEMEDFLNSININI